MNRLQQQEQLQKQRAVGPVKAHRVEPKIAPKVVPPPKQEPYTKEDRAAERTDELNKRLEEEIAVRTGKVSQTMSEVTPAKSDQKPVQLPAQPAQKPVQLPAQPAQKPVQLPAQPAQKPVQPPVQLAKAAPKKPSAKRIAPKPMEESTLTDEQRNAIVEYIRFDDEILKAKAALKKLQKDQLTLQPLLASALKNMPVKSGNTVLRVKTSETKEGISQRFLIRKLAESGELKNPDNAKEVIENIYKSRQVKGVKETIERKI